MSLGFLLLFLRLFYYYFFFFAFECNFIIFPSFYLSLSFATFECIPFTIVTWLTATAHFIILVSRRIKYMVHICSARCARQAICAHIHINFYIFLLLLRLLRVFIILLAVRCLTCLCLRKNVTMLCALFCHRRISLHFHFSEFEFHSSYGCVRCFDNRIHLELFLFRPFDCSTFAVYVKLIGILIPESIFHLSFSLSHFSRFFSSKSSRNLRYWVDRYESISRCCYQKYDRSQFDTKE